MTKIHVPAEVLGDPVGFHLTGVKEHDLEGADPLLPGMAAHRLIDDKAFDVDERVCEPQAVAGKTAVILPHTNRKDAPAFDRDLYKESATRLRISLAGSSNFGLSLPVSKRRPATSPPPYD